MASWTANPEIWLVVPGVVFYASGQVNVFWPIQSTHFASDVAVM